jgi:hypothetical protein
MAVRLEIIAKTNKKTVGIQGPCSSYSENSSDIDGMSASTREMCDKIALNYCKNRPLVNSDPFYQPLK